MLYSIYRRLSPALELRFLIETSSALSLGELYQLQWLVAETYEPHRTGTRPNLPAPQVVEIGPRRQIETAFSSNAVAICHAIGIQKVTRVEQTRRYLIGDGEKHSPAGIIAQHLDQMTQEIYPHELVSFDTGLKPEPVQIVDLLGLGINELRRQNKANGWGMDARDIEYNFDLFVRTLGRNPTNVELLQLANGNSEHSRHWYFRGHIMIDGVVMPQTLFNIVREPLKRLGPDNCSIIAFHDNAGAIEGFRTLAFVPRTPGGPSAMSLVRRFIHLTGTAETHNHPTMVSPFPGAQTGVGGRKRDTAAVGRGGLIGVGGAGYFVGNLHIPGHQIAGEVAGCGKRSQYAQPPEILLHGSDGTTTYSNEFGEPNTFGFTRTFGQEVGDEWLEPRKPILYSCSSGQLYDGHEEKKPAKVGMLIVAIGGPAYPIGVGGGAASSVQAGQSNATLDFSSVQRGDAEMANRVNRVIATCIEMASDNPILSIHDQGAGGPSNVLTELLEPLGGRINIRGIQLGDKTMSVLEIWSAEYQERFGFLIAPEQINLFKTICERERVNCEVLGQITGDGNVVVHDPQTGETPVNLALKHILSEMPPKTFETNREERVLPRLNLPTLTVNAALKAVFSLPAVGSKGFLVHKGDRSVGGKVAQQQTCGIAQIAIADASVLAQSHFGLTGSVQALGENPNRMLINPKAGARMAVGEMLTNMAGVLVTDISDIRCRANWMWPAKLPHEGARLYDAVLAMSEIMIELEIAADGGKDSLSMAAMVEGTLVKTPGSLVVFGYAPVPKITKKVTPDIKQPGSSLLGLIDLGLGKNRLGGSAIAQAFNQLGNESPDVDDPKLLRNAFRAIQELIREELILAMHDRSDGGLITAVAEMCMASHCGFNLSLRNVDDTLAQLFSEELGFVIELRGSDEERVVAVCEKWQVPFRLLGTTTVGGQCLVTADEQVLFESTTETLRGWWEATSHALERLQVTTACADTEFGGHSHSFRLVSADPQNYRLTFEVRDTSPTLIGHEGNPRVAVVRQEGTNGEREMQAALMAAGLEPWDISMSDLLAGRASLDTFQGVVFAGGFSYMDVFGSAKGWAATIRFNPRLREMFDRFYDRPDTFSLGVCNGCQLMALLGWVPWKGLIDEDQPRFVHNESGRFESRWVQVEVQPNPSILLRDMVGSRLGIWVAHGEGRVIFPNKDIEQEVLELQLAPLAFIDPTGQPTETYPYNPNGSPHGITALCSENGRHLAMMPHLERGFRLWQWPWMPPSWRTLPASPWLKPFQNARSWCLENQAKP